MKILLIKVQALLLCVGLIIAIGFGSVWVLRKDIPMDVIGWSVLLALVIVALLIAGVLVVERAINEINKKEENG